MNNDTYAIYEGTEPYLFISYSHQDKKQVEPIIHGLQAMGYRLWYDTGIAIGGRWADIIAEHVMKSSCVVAFLSRNAMASDYCQEEIFFALEEHRPIIPVYLEEIVLPPGLRMRLNIRQMIYRYEFKSDTDFLMKLDKEQSVSPCKKLPPRTQALPVSSVTAPNSVPSEMTERFMEYLLTAYLKYDPAGLNAQFIRIGDFAVKKKRFTYSEISSALGVGNATNQCLNRMRNIGIIRSAGPNTYMVRITPDDWNAFIAFAKRKNKIK